MRCRNDSVVFPNMNSEIDILRYAVQSCDPDAGEFHLLVHAYSAYLTNGCLTKDEMFLIKPFLIEVIKYIN